MKQNFLIIVTSERLPNWRLLTVMVVKTPERRFGVFIVNFEHI